MVISPDGFRPGSARGQGRRGLRPLRRRRGHRRQHRCAGRAWNGELGKPWGNLGKTRGNQGKSWGFSWFSRKHMGKHGKTMWFNWEKWNIFMIWSIFKKWTFGTLKELTWFNHETCDFAKKMRIWHSKVVISVDLTVLTSYLTWLIYVNLMWTRKGIMTTEIRRFGKIWLRLGVSLNWGPRNNGSPNPKDDQFWWFWEVFSF